MKNSLIPSLRRAARAFARRLGHTQGAIDLASIMVGVIVLGVIGSVISASVFAVIPWAQDRAATSNLASVSVAESVSHAMNGEIQSYDNHAASRYRLMETTAFSRPSERLVIDAMPDGGGWVAATASASGAVYVGTSTGAEVSRAIDANGSLALPAGIALPEGFTADRALAVVRAVGSGAAYDFGAAERPGFGGSDAGEPGGLHFAGDIGAPSVSAYSGSLGREFAFFDGAMSVAGSAAWVQSLGLEQPGRFDTLTPGLREGSASLAATSLAAPVTITAASGFATVGDVVFFLDASGDIQGISVSPHVTTTLTNWAAFTAQFGGSMKITFPGGSSLAITLGAPVSYEYWDSNDSGGPATGDGPERCWSTPPTNPNPSADGPPPPAPVEIPCP